MSTRSLGCVYSPQNCTSVSGCIVCTHEFIFFLPPRKITEIRRSSAFWIRWSQILIVWNNLHSSFLLELFFYLILFNNFRNAASSFLQCATQAWLLRAKLRLLLLLKIGLFIIVEMPLALLGGSSWGSFLSSHAAVNLPRLRAPRGPCRGRCHTERDALLCLRSLILCFLPLSFAAVQQLV